VLANNSSVIGNVIVNKKIHSNLPGAGAVLEPKVCIISILYNIYIYIYI